MTPLSLLWLLSIGGAMLFFGAGYFWAQRKPARPLGEFRAPIPSVTTASPRRAHTEADLEQVLQSIAGLPGMQAAVLADELGLPIAALGEHAEPLAAFAGFVDGVAEKSRSYLPMSRVHRIIIEDEDRTTIAAHPSPLGEGSIAIVTLTAGQPPSEEQMDRVLASATRTFSLDR